MRAQRDDREEIVRREESGPRGCVHAGRGVVEVGVQPEHEPAVQHGGDVHEHEEHEIHAAACLQPWHDSAARAPAPCDERRAGAQLQCARREQRQFDVAVAIQAPRGGHEREVRVHTGQRAQVVGEMDGDERGDQQRRRAMQAA